MKFDVLFPGPSLVRYPVNDWQNIRIAVNLAIVSCPCEWWAFVDVEAYIEVVAPDKARRKVLDGPTPRWVKGAKLCTRKAHLRRIKDKGIEPPRIIEKDIRHIKRPPQTDHVPAISGPLGIMLAYHLGATTVNIWGLDMRGRKYFNGADMGPAHLDRHWQNRFDRDRQYIEPVITSMEKQGIEVNRKGDAW